jgi:hypothetical protein
MTYPNTITSPASRSLPFRPAFLIALAGIVVSLAACRGGGEAPIEQVPAEERPANFVEGEVVVAPELRDQLTPDGTLFLFLRKPEAGRMPIATLRGNFPAFPYSFVLSEENILFDNFAFEGEMTLHARFSKGGNPVGSIGDLEGDCTTNPVKPGQRGLRIVLDQVVKEERQSSMNQRPMAPSGEVEDYE